VQWTTTDKQDKLLRSLQINLKSPLEDKQATASQALNVSWLDA
jgi:hypothetical protein